MKRFLSVVLVLAIIFSMGVPLASAVENPQFMTYINGSIDAVSFGGSRTLCVNWLYQDMGSQLTLQNTQGIRLAYDKTVLQLIRWDASSGYNEEAWNTTFVNCPDAASPDEGEYPYNFNVAAAQNTAGTIGYVNLTLGDSEETYSSFLLETLLMKVRFAFRSGKSAADLTASSIRCMTAEELRATRQSSAVSLTTDEGTIYSYLNQAGDDLLNEPEFSIPGSSGGASLLLSESSWSAAATGGSTSVRVTSNTTWTASSNATGWLTVTPSSGSNNATLTLNASANTGTSSRTGTVTVTGGGITRTVSVTQAGASQTAGAVASISAPSVYGNADTLTYTISLDNEFTGINQFTVTARFDPDKLSFANESEILIPNGSFISERWDPDTGEYRAWVVLMSSGSLFTAPNTEPILKVKFNITGSDSDIAGILTGVSVVEVSSPTHSVTVNCSLDTAAVVSKYAPYDINGDGKLDMEDISLIVYNYYMVGEGNTKWGEAKIYDVDNNGFVTIVDIMSIAMLAEI